MSTATGVHCSDAAFLSAVEAAAPQILASCAGIGEAIGQGFVAMVQRLQEATVYEVNPRTDIVTATNPYLPGSGVGLTKALAWADLIESVQRELEDRR